MAENIALADTSVLIDYFRKTDKANSKIIHLFDQGYDFNISVISYYEVYTGATSHQLPFWSNFLTRIRLLPLDKNVAQVAVEINKSLKIKRKQISIADLFIAATAISNNMPLSTLNTKHFERIEGLIILK